MKAFTLVASTLVIGALAVHAADDRTPVPVPRTPAPTVQRAPQPTEAPVYEQRLYGPGAGLVSQEKADQVVQAFRATYEKLGKPRLAFYVNRDLIDERSGLKLSGRKEKTESVVGEKRSSFEADPNAPAPEAGANPQTQVNVAIDGGQVGSAAPDHRPGKGSSESRTTTVTGENTYAAVDAAAAPTLADRLTAREIETLFGRPFRVAGAVLADQKLASSLVDDKTIDHHAPITNEAARKDREALAKIADVVIEVLVSSRSMTLASVSGDRTVSVPDIQVTAIRLSDSAVLGQASAADVLGKDRYAARIAHQFDAREITEATALALMEDMALAYR